MGPADDHDDFEENMVTIGSSKYWQNNGAIKKLRTVGPGNGHAFAARDQHDDPTSGVIVH